MQMTHQEPWNGLPRYCMRLRAFVVFCSFCIVNCIRSATHPSLGAALRHSYHCCRAICMCVLCLGCCLPIHRCTDDVFNGIMFAWFVSLHEPLSDASAYCVRECYPQPRLISIWTNAPAAKHHTHAHNPTVLRRLHTSTCYRSAEHIPAHGSVVLWHGSSWRMHSLVIINQIYCIHLHSVLLLYRFQFYAYGQPLKTVSARCTGYSAWIHIDNSTSEMKFGNTSNFKLQRQCSAEMTTNEITNAYPIWVQVHLLCI